MDSARKEALRREHIIRDLLAADKSLFWKKAEIHFCFIGPFLLLSLLLGAIFHKLWLSAVCLFPVVYHVIRLVFRIVHSIRRRKSIRNGNFRISTEKLVNIGTETIYEPPFAGTTTHLFRDIEFFYMEYGKWRVPHIEHYPWSSLYRMSTAGLKNTSILNDEFYVVTLSFDDEIGYVYNCRLFTNPDISK